MYTYTYYIYIFRYIFSTNIIPGIFVEVTNFEEPFDLGIGQWLHTGFGVETGGSTSSPEQEEREGCGRKRQHFRQLCVFFDP